MGIFGPEKPPGRYSKEAYEKAELIARGAEHGAQDIGTVTGMGAEETQQFYDRLWSDAAKARGWVERLKGKAQKEATALNEEYERLRIRAQEALEVLVNFEREKLGMHQENPDSHGEEGKEKS